MNQGTTLVLGGTGKTGRRVARRLEALGTKVRIGSRSGSPPFDWERPQGWSEALQGIQSVYLAFAPDLAAAGSGESISAFMEQAAARGVSQVVMLSGRGEPEAQACERIVQDSRLAWTVLRASWFDQNFSEGFLLGPLLEGELALPAGAVTEPFVDAEDIAEVAVAALVQARHAGQVYELTGPAPLSFAQAVASIGQASGRELRYREIPRARFAAMLREAEVPPDYVALLDYLFGEVLDGRNSGVAEGVAQVLGREARSFPAFARQTAATGVWAGAPNLKAALGPSATP